jgi:phage gp29-like protein
VADSLLSRARSFLGSRLSPAPAPVVEKARKKDAPQAPARAVVVEPTIRSYQEWSPSLIRAAEVQADGGYMRLAADLTEWMLGDDRVKAVLDSRTDALLGLDLSFEPGRGRRKGAAVKALEAGEDWWSAYPETEIKLLHAWGLSLGVGLARQEWETKGDRLIPRLRIMNPRWLRWDWSTRSWKLTVVTETDSDSGSGVNASSHEIEITPGDGEWILYTPYGSSRPWVYGAYRALSRWVLLKKLAIGDWGFYSERQGMGTWIVTGADGSETQRKQISDDMQSLGRNAALALPAGFDMRLVESVARSQELFALQITTADNGIAVSLLGQNLTTQNDGGSLAATTQHGKTGLGRTKADAETLSTTLHDQSLVWWSLYNFGTVDAAPWPAWNTTPTEDDKSRAGMIQMVSQAVSAFVTAGAPVDVPALLASFRIPTLPVPAALPAPAPEPGSPSPAEPSPEAAPAPAPSPAPAADPGASA